MLQEEDKRPDPDELLERINSERRGRLVVFLGPAAGVGKTYAMLEAAHERLKAGQKDVVIGWVETHGRAETQALLTGLEIIPPKKVSYRGKALQEMDLDAILRRHPQLALIDELAHTNVPGSRHAKRYQDVEELLDAGIDVFTTLNIQHLESLNDVIAQVTGVTVKETIPDGVLERADEIRLIDLSPEDLIQRLKEGKVYVPEQAQRALKHFFRPGNINALRELALRHAAERVDDQLERYMKAHDIEGPWPVDEKVLVCVSPSPFSANLVRLAYRMAERLRAEWVAVNVEQPGRSLDERERHRLMENLRLAEELGAEIVTLTGHDIADTLAQFARTRNVTHIIIGKPLKPLLVDVLRGSVVDRIMRLSKGISIHVIPGVPRKADVLRPDRQKNSRQKMPGGLRLPEDKLSVWAYPMAFLAILVITLLALRFVSVLSDVDLNLVYLIPILVASWRWGYGPAIFSAILGFLALDFFFTPPFYTLAIGNIRHGFTLVMFLAVGVMVSSLASRLRCQAIAASRREQRTASLYRLSKGIAAMSRLSDLVDLVSKEASVILNGDVVVMLPDGGGGLSVQSIRGVSGSYADGLKEAADRNDSPPQVDEKERATATWVFDHGHVAGQGTDTLSWAAYTYVPMKTARGVVGVVGLHRNEMGGPLFPDEQHMLETLAGLAAIFIERAKLADEAKKAEVLAATEKLRMALLDSVSHDLRTPLSSILGAVTSLLEDDSVYSRETRRSLLETIRDEAEHMNGLVGNLLDMARLETGVLRLRRDWCDMDDVLGSALRRLGSRIDGRSVKIDLEPDLPLVYADFVLIEQVMVNILDNAVKYSPPGSQIDVALKRKGENVQVTVSDRGFGIPKEHLEKVFEKFYRMKGAGVPGGTGLGLSICKGIVEAHGGRIWAENREGGGTKVAFLIPIGGKPENMIG